MTPQIKHIMKKINITKKVKNDIILTASILIVAVLVFFIISLISNNGNYVEIKKNGEIIGKYSLFTDRTVEIRDENGYNLLVIEDGKAYISDASCPDKLCMKQGKVSSSGAALVCLPNKTVITIYSDTNSQVDFVS